MSELEEKLNALLSDPNSMAQVMQMAQQLSGAMGEQKAAAPPPHPRCRRFLIWGRPWVAWTRSCWGSCCLWQGSWERKTAPPCSCSTPCARS